MRAKTFLWAYMILLHILVAAVLANTDFLQRTGSKIGLWTPSAEEPELSAHYHRMMQYHRHIDGSVLDGSVLFVGDSITQGLCVSAVADRAVNFGIGSDTTVGVLDRLPQYASLPRARSVVIAVGVNDLARRQNADILGNFTRILSSIPEHVRLIVSAVLPVDERADTGHRGYNSRIHELNAAVQKRCLSRINCSFFDSGNSLMDASGNLDGDYHVGDGVHLNPGGYAIWIDDLKKAMAK